MTRYSREDVLRILHLQTRQLVAWERAGLIPVLESFSFEHLAQLRALGNLCSARISAKSIRASVDAMQKVAGMRNPLLEASAEWRGSRLSFRHAGALVDPVTQQLGFDFACPAGGKLHVVRAGLDAGRQAAEVQEMFLRAVRMEELPATVPEAALVYAEILELQPNHAPALINLGTIHYNQRRFEQAEAMYRQATVADGEYALAFFDLGNVLDEMQRLPEAIESYRRAVELVPQYADAHYNLALAYERAGPKRRALRHWRSYLRLDPVGPWADHAKGQAQRILSVERLSIVSRRGRRVQA